MLFLLKIVSDFPLFLSMDNNTNIMDCNEGTEIATKATNFDEKSTESFLIEEIEAEEKTFSKHDTKESTEEGSENLLKTVSDFPLFLSIDNNTNIMDCNEGTEITAGVTNFNEKSPESFLTEENKAEERTLSKLDTKKSTEEGTEILLKTVSDSPLFLSIDNNTNIMDCNEGTEITTEAANFDEKSPESFLIEENKAEQKTLLEHDTKDSTEEGNEILSSPESLLDETLDSYVEKNQSAVRSVKSSLPYFCPPNPDLEQYLKDTGKQMAEINEGISADKRVYEPTDKVTIICKPLSKFKKYCKFGQDSKKDDISPSLSVRKTASTISSVNIADEECVKVYKNLRNNSNSAHNIRKEKVLLFEESSDEPSIDFEDKIKDVVGEVSENVLSISPVQLEMTNEIMNFEDSFDMRDSDGDSKVKKCTISSISNSFTTKRLKWAESKDIYCKWIHSGSFLHSQLNHDAHHQSVDRASGTKDMPDFGITLHDPPIGNASFASQDLASICSGTFKNEEQEGSEEEKGNEDEHISQEDRDSEYEGSDYDEEQEGSDEEKGNEDEHMSAQEDRYSEYEGSDNESDEDIPRKRRKILNDTDSDNEGAEQNQKKSSSGIEDASENESEVKVKRKRLLSSDEEQNESGQESDYEVKRKKVRKILDDDSEQDSDDESAEQNQKKNNSGNEDASENGDGKKAEEQENIQTYFENEAELSGEDDGMEEDEENEDDHNIENLIDDNELTREEEIRDGIMKVYTKKIKDDDDELLKLYQEEYLPEGDLYSQGPGRTRQFAWKNNDLPHELKEDNDTSTDSEDAEESWFAKSRKTAKLDDDVIDTDLPHKSPCSSTSYRECNVKIKIIGKPEFKNLEVESGVKQNYRKKSRGSLMNLEIESNSIIKRLKLEEIEETGSRTTKHFVFRNDSNRDGVNEDEKNVNKDSVFNKI